jgi:hypothetical protein
MKSERTIIEIQEENERNAVIVIFGADVFFLREIK